METRRLITILTAISVAIVIAIGGIVVASSLGGDDDGGSSASNGDNGDNGDGGPTPDLPERQEGELRLFGPDPVTLDPACASDAGSAEYIVEIFSGLVSFNRDLELIPDIAQDWDVSPDRTVTRSTCGRMSSSTTPRAG
jgi:peptide/nickel transport system substrate-binding protein/oligopeptide transport system substrate-binding protein